MPNWNPDKLQSHYDKHPGGRDGYCWMDICDKPTQVSIDKYEEVSYEVIDICWLEYVCQEQHGDSVHKKSRIYVDDRMIKVITDFSGQWINTCFHEHYDKPHVFKKNQNTLIGELRDEFWKYLKWDEDSGQVKELDIKNDYR